MRTQIATWLGTLARIALLLFAAQALASTTPPHEYHVLSPEPLNGPVSVMSLEPNNTITVGGTQVTLQQYERATIPATAFTSGSRFSGTGFFTVGSNESAADLLVPDDFAGTTFVVPHIAGAHKYFLLSPSGTAQVTVQLGATTYNLTANEGVVNEFDAGSDNGLAGRITSDVPILVTHVAYLSASARDAYPVPPASAEVFGVRSQNTIVAALSDGTSVTVYSSNGASGAYTLDAGQQVTVTTGVAGAQGQGNALRIVANAPIAAVQYDDGDGSDATAFWSAGSFGRRHAVPIDAQYLAVVCEQPSVTVTLYKGANPPETQVCSGSSTTPGKAYFGSNASGANLAAGWYAISSSPVYVMYEASAAEDEHNLLGVTPAAGPSAPTLNTIGTPTSNNPQSVSGNAGANQTVRLYVNGLLQATATADGSGNYTFNAALIDGINTLYTTAVVSGNESDPSNAASVEYVNSIPRTQSGTISSSAVWTPGNPATPYTITASLTVAAGAKLTLQPGTTLRFANGTVLTVNGELKIAGTAAQPVVLTSNAATPARGSWSGVLINASGSSIEYATIEYTLTGVNIAGVTATVRNNTIRYFTNNGVYVSSGAGAASTVIRSNTIDNLNDTGDCIEANNSSPQIIGNTLTNCDKGVHVVGAAAPSVTGRNVITGNDYGVYVNGSSGVAAMPVVTGNRITASDNNNYFVTTFGATGANLKLNATGNWWGSTDPTAIAATISDLTDNTATTVPSVDYSNFLDAPDGDAVTGNYLLGKVLSSTALIGGTTYDVLGAIIVNSGVTLTIPAGTTLRFHGNSILAVDGVLAIQGTSTSLVTLTSGRAAPARDNWPGVLIRANGSTIEYARIEYTTTAINIAGVTATVRNNTLRYFLNNGVYVSAGAGAAATTIQNNTIDNLNDTGDCIELVTVSPQVSGNTLTNCSRGIFVNGTSSPAITGNNIITGNANGVYLSTGSPQPVVTGNQIYGNTTNNFFADAFAAGAQNLVINATGNWWGTTNPTTIADGILDLSDDYGSTDRPIVSFGNYLSGPGGTPVAGNYLQGRVTTSGSLQANTVYDVVGAYMVNSGVTLTIPAGTTLRFHGSTSTFVVDGVVNIQGTSTSPVTLTSGQPTPARGDWPGVLIRANGSLIEHARIEYSATAINIAGATATVRNSRLRYFLNNGVYVSAGAGAAATVIQNNIIDNLNDTGDCIEISGASPQVMGNLLTNCSRGLFVNGAAAPTVNGNNVMTGNVTGVALSTGSPQPVVNGNQIHGNSSVNFLADAMAAGAQNLIIDATGNWWGTTNPTTIGGTITDLTDAYTVTDRPSVNFGSMLEAPLGTPVPGNYLIGPLSATTTTLTAGATYDVLGVVFVGNGKSLEIPAGVTLRFHSTLARLVVDGTLSIQGVDGNPVTLTSGRLPLARGQWTGVLVRNGSTPSLIDHARIEWADRAVEFAAGSAGTVRNSEIVNFSEAGIYLTSTTAATLIEANVIDNSNDAGSCLFLSTASPTIQGNTLRNCQYGLRLSGNTTAAVNGNNIIHDNLYGVYATTGTPRPVVTGNQIFSNTTYNFYADAYAAGAQNVVVNATGNWWGTANPSTIGAGILDLTDSYTATDRPVVNFSGFLGGPGGGVVPGQQLIGPFSATSTTLTAGETYEVIGLVTVGTGKSLTIPEGTILRFYSTHARLVVDGTLTIEGSSTSPVILTSAKATPARGNWPGVLIRNGSTSSLIEHAQIEWAERGVELAAGATATVRNSVITNFADSGIYFTSSTAATLISGNVIDNLDDTGACLYLATASPTIQGNTLRNCQYGLRLSGTSTAAVNSNNVIHSNVQGVYASTGSPQPVVTGNQIYDNTTNDFYADSYATGAQALTVNATGNWWGTTSATAIVNNITDLTDSYTATDRPVVNFSGFLDGPNGAPVPGPQLIGALSAASTTLTAGATYDVLGVVFVGAGKSLTIPAGVTLRHHGATSRLVIDGALSVQGTDAARVKFTSGLRDPAKGAWQGIEVRATATSVAIDYAIIEWAERALSVTGTNATITHSILRSFGDTGVWMSGASASSQIVNNYIDNFDNTGYGIYLTASSPAITNNQIYRTSVGIYAIGASNPLITGNAITNNGRGIVLDGGNSNSATAVPNPTITGNDIFGNVTSQLDVYNYGTTNPVVINATDNWWGTATPVAGTHVRFTSGSPTTSLNYSNPSNAPRTRPVSGNVALSSLYFSPNADGVQDSTTISGSLNQSSNWTVTVSSGSGVVRTFTGSGTSISASWNGQDGGGQTLPDGVYTIEVTATAATGTNLVGSRVATIDNTPPVTAITSPTASTSISNVLSVPVNGTASDRHLVSYTLQYGAGATPTTWTTLATQSGAAGASNALLATWVVGNSNGAAGLPNGPYVLRLASSDKAGNTGLVLVPVTIDLMSVTGVSQNLKLIRPLAGEQLQVNFTLGAPASVKLQIYPEAGGALVREISQTFTSAGAKSMSWDGRNGGGAFVADEAYSYAIQANDGARIAAYDPPAPGTIGSGSGTVDSTFNANKNDFWKMDYTMNHYGRVRMQVSGCTSTTHFPYNWVPFPPGVHPLVWDGRDANGRLVSGACEIYFDPPQHMKSNMVIVRGTQPRVTGSGATPNIEVKSNPYRIVHSYEQISKITYRVDQDSYVTVKLLPPGVSDIGSPQAIVLTETVLQAAQSGGQPVDYQIDWKGYEELDTNNILVSEQGSYTFAIQATGVTSGATTVYRGVLQLWQ